MLFLTSERFSAEIQNMPADNFFYTIDREISQKCGFNSSIAAECVCKLQALLWAYIGSICPATSGISKTSHLP